LATTHFEQQLQAVLATLSVACILLAASTTKSGGVTEFRCAQATFSTSVKQQQFVQHWLADWHPQGRF